MERIIYFLLLISFIGTCYTITDPRLDWNFETGERVIWYNHPFYPGTRNYLTLPFWKKSFE